MSCTRLKSRFFGLRYGRRPLPRLLQAMSDGQMMRFLREARNITRDDDIASIDVSPPSPPAPSKDLPEPCHGTYVVALRPKVIDADQHHFMSCCLRLVETASSSPHPTQVNTFSRLSQKRCSFLPSLLLRKTFLSFQKNTQNVPPDDDFRH